MNAVTRVQPDGRLVIFAEAIAAAHLAPGVEVAVEVRAEGVLLRRHAPPKPFKPTTREGLRALRLYEGPAKRFEAISAAATGALADHYKRERPGD